METKQPAWVRCECCEDFWCTRHQLHVYDCKCPSLEKWKTDPYSVDEPGPAATKTAARKKR